MKIRSSYKVLKLFLGIMVLALVFICIKPSHAFASYYDTFFNAHGGNVQTGIIYNSGGSCNPAAPSTIKTNNNLVGSTYYGASGQMAAIATLNQIYEFASGENPNYSSVNSGLNSATVLPYTLTFSNLTTNGGQLGSGYPSCVPNYYNQTNTTGSWTTPSGTYNLGTLSSGTHLYSGAKLVISASTIPASAHIVIVVKGQDVIIRGNISYAAYTGVSTLPQLEIIDYGGNTYVDDSVSSIEGVYVDQPNSGAGGFIITCGSGSGTTENPDKTYSDCKTNPLAVNGSLSANVIEMLRTAGDAGQTTSPWTTAAEIYTYSPEVWLSEASVPYYVSTPTYQDIVDLPPLL